MIQSPKPANPVLHLPQLTGSISFKPDIGDQEINLYIQEVHPVIQKSQTILFHAPACITSMEDTIVVDKICHLEKMVKDMQVKFDKYWENYSVILAMGEALDSRIKIEMLEVAYKELDPSTSGSKIEELKKSLYALYKD